MKKKDERNKRETEKEKTKEESRKNDMKTIGAIKIYMSYISVFLSFLK